MERFFLFFFSNALFLRGKHSVTWQEDSLTWEWKGGEWMRPSSQMKYLPLKGWTETLPCLRSVPLFFFFDVAQGHLLSAVPPDLCHQWRGSDNMGLERNALHPLCAVPATVLEIQLLSGQLTVPAQADLFGTGRKEECNSANSEALICTLLPSL